MKKLMSVMAVATISTFMLAGCENMSAKDQRIGAAALGGAVGGGVGNRVGGGVGAAVGGGAGAAVGSKAQGGSNRNATYSGVGGA
ncbi:DNA transfer protein p32, partial [Acinetobacter variabilis]